MDNNRINKLALKYVVPYLVILLISLLTGWIVYNKTSEVLQNEVEKSNIALLEQGMTVLDNRMKETDLIIQRITNDTSVIRLQQIHDPYDSENLYKIIETQKRLKDYSFLNNFFSQYYIFFKNSNLVMSDTITEKIPDFHRILRYEAQTAEEQADGFYSEIVNEYHYREILPVQDVWFEGRRNQVMTYVHSFGSSDFSRASIMVLLNYEEISKLFQGINISGGGWAYITDEEGNILSMSATQASEKPQLALPSGQKNGIFKADTESEEFVVTFVTSEYNGWTYVAAQPAEIVLERINYIKKITFFIFFAFLFVGIILASYIAYRNSKPVHALMQSNAELHNRLENQLPFIRSAFFERLLKGDFSAESDIKALLKHIKADVSGDFFIAAIIYIREDFIELNEKILADLAKKKLILKESIDLLMDHTSVTHDLDEESIALVFTFKRGEKENMVTSAAEQLSTLQQHVNKEYQITTVCSLGNVYQNLLDISRSFNEAEQALVRSNENRLSLYQHIYQDENSYYYPEHMELQIISCVKAGNEKQLNVLLSELYRANFLEKSLPAVLLKIWLFDMWASLIKIVEQVSMAEVRSPELLAAAYKVMENKDNPEMNFQQLCQALLGICRLVDDKKSGNKSALFMDIKSFIDQHYTSSDLSLTMIADRFNLSEAYLSRTFKEQTGDTFFDYLGRKRLERTKQLLTESDLSIGEIALKVGYNSMNTFGRAFKRATGITAMTYRELNKQ